MSYCPLKDNESSIGIWAALVRVGGEGALTTVSSLHYRSLSLCTHSGNITMGHSHDLRHNQGLN